MAQAGASLRSRASVFALTRVSRRRVWRSSTRTRCCPPRDFCSKHHQDHHRTAQPTPAHPSPSQHSTAQHRTGRYNAGLGSGQKVTRFPFHTWRFVVGVGQGLHTTALHTTALRTTALNCPVLAFRLEPLPHPLTDKKPTINSAPIDKKAN